MALTKSPEQQADHEKFYGLAMELADELCVKINAEAPKLETYMTQYQRRHVLEEVIKILQGRV